MANTGFPSQGFLLRLYAAGALISLVLGIVHAGDQSLRALCCGASVVLALIGFFLSGESAGGDTATGIGRDSDWADSDWD